MELWETRPIDKFNTKLTFCAWWVKGPNWAPTWLLMTPWEACHLLQVHFGVQIQDSQRHGCVSCLILSLTSKISLALIFHQPQEQCWGCALQMAKHMARVPNPQNLVTSSWHGVTLFCLLLWCPWWPSWWCCFENEHLHHSKWFIFPVTHMHSWITCQQIGHRCIDRAWSQCHAWQQNITNVILPELFCQMFDWSWDEQTDCELALELCNEAKFIWLYLINWNAFARFGCNKNNSLFAFAFVHCFVIAPNMQLVHLGGLTLADCWGILPFLAKILKFLNERWQRQWCHLINSPWSSLAFMWLFCWSALVREQSGELVRLPILFAKTCS